MNRIQEIIYKSFSEIFCEQCEHENDPKWLDECKICETNQYFACTEKYAKEVADKIIKMLGE